MERERAVARKVPKVAWRVQVCALVSAPYLAVFRWPVNRLDVDSWLVAGGDPAAL